MNDSTSHSSMQTSPPRSRFLTRPPTGWASVVLVGLMLLCVAWSISAANPTPGIGILEPIVLGGVLAGAVLGSQRWLPTALAHAWSIVAGAVVTLTAAAHALPSFPHAPASALAALGLFERIQVVRDWYIGWITLVEDGAGVDSRAFLGGLAYGPSDRTDLAYLFFAVTMALLMWLLSYICTWFIVRYISWWGAVLPAGFALVFNVTNARGDGPYLLYLAFFLLFAFLLAVQTHLALQTERWRRERIGYSPDIGLEFLRDGALVAVAVIVVGWLLPAEIKSGDLQAWMRRMTASSQRGVAQHLNQWFPTLSYPARGGGNAFGEQMGLQGAITLGDNLVFEASVPAGGPVPRYWRQAVFDLYDGTGWRRTVDAQTEADTGGHALAAAAALTVPVTQTIRTLQAETRQLYAAPQPERFDLPIRAEVAGGVADVLTVESQVPLGVGTTYRAVSLLSAADAASLRAASNEDPDWVAGRYRQVPDTLPDSVRAKAVEVTTGATSRYDAASAIESYLRTFPYSEQIGQPPADRDRVEWFLFEEQQGYCDYYSSAFVMLARSVGIPARVAAGYATGEAIGDGWTFRQKAYDAHTWPEVYFPGYGWIEFEPTANRQVVARPDTPGELSPAAAAEPDPAEGEDFAEIDPLQERQPASMPATAPAAVAAGDGGARVPIWPLFGLAAALGLVAGVAWMAWQRPLRGLSMAESLFARLARVAGWLGLRAGPGDTPHEYGRRIAGAIPESGGEISTIVDAYVRERFGRRGLGGGETDDLVGAWRRVRDRLVRSAGRLGWGRVRRRG